MKYPVEKKERSEKELKKEAFQEKLDEIVEVVLTYLILGAIIAIPVFGVVGLFAMAFEQIFK